MIELPEPIGATYTIAGIQHCTITQVLPDAKLYTEAQLKQVVLDAYEEAAKQFDDEPNAEQFRNVVADTIRELIKGIDP